MATLPTETRTRCACCAHPSLSTLQTLPDLPVLPICTEEPRKSDFQLPLEITICDKCGLLQLRTLVSQEEIYRIPHSEGIGKTWEGHYREFETFIKSQWTSEKSAPKAIEIGAGAGKLAHALSQWAKITIFEPNFTGEKENLEVIDSFFDRESAQTFRGEIDLIYSSHTLEHFYDFPEYFETSALALRPGGKLITAVPNLESALHCGYSNALNFEHTAMLSLSHLFYLHARFGFEIEKIQNYLDHGIYLCARKTEKSRTIELDTRAYMKFLLNRFMGELQATKQKVESHLGSSASNYLFGASQLSQFLFSIGLEEHHFDGLLDNAKTKHHKRLYGTELRSSLPEPVVSDLSKTKAKARIFVNGGPYSEEIASQLKGIVQPGTELVVL